MKFEKLLLSISIIQALVAAPNVALSDESELGGELDVEIQTLEKDIETQSRAEKKAAAIREAQRLREAEEARGAEDEQNAFVVSSKPSARPAQAPQLRGQEIVVQQPKKQDMTVTVKRLNPAKAHKATTVSKKSAPRASRKQVRVARKFSKKAVVIAAAPQQPQNQTPATVVATEPAPEKVLTPPSVIREESPTLTLRTAPRGKRLGQGFFRNFTLLGQGSIGTFDGPDKQIVVPEGVTNPYNGGVSGMITTDLNLIGSRTLSLETGVSFLRTGSYTGYLYRDVSTQYYGNNNNNTVTLNDQVLLNYIGMPIMAKWRLSGYSGSSFYARAGASPMYLMKTEYASNTTSYGYLNESRFGEFSSFDVILSGAIGYALNVYKDFNVVIDAGYYHGMLPVTSYYNIFNTGFTVGLGVSYTL